jgi:hypothetical protein
MTLYTTQYNLYSLPDITRVAESKRTVVAKQNAMSERHDPYYSVPFDRAPSVSETAHTNIPCQRVGKLS